jgi:hypothetical protein
VGLPIYFFDYSPHAAGTTWWCVHGEDTYFVSNPKLRRLIKGGNNFIAKTYGFKGFFSKATLIYTSEVHDELIS